MAKPAEQTRCHVCRQFSLRRLVGPYVGTFAYEGREYELRIPDLEVVRCTNPNCKPDDPDETTLLDDAAIQRISDEKTRTLGLLMPAEIRERRERLGLTQQELQELLGLGGNSLSRWESGAYYQSRAMDTLLRLVFDNPALLRQLRKLRAAAATRVA